MTKLESFSASTVGKRIGLAIVAISLTVGALPVDNAYAETKAPVAIERQVVAERAPFQTNAPSGTSVSNYGSEIDQIKQDLADRSRACEKIISVFEANRQQIVEIAQDATKSPTDRVTSMIEVGQKAMDTALAVKVHPDMKHPSLSLPVKMGVESIASNFKEQIGGYLGNARDCVRRSDQQLATMNAPPASHAQSHESSARHGHGGSGWNTRSILGAGVVANHMRHR
jgi:hypothetical protein